MEENIRNIVAEIIEKSEENGGIKQVYFVGCGGSLGALYPAKVFLEKESTNIKTAWINSN